MVTSTTVNPGASGAANVSQETDFKDPGQNYLVNTEGVAEWLLAGRDSRAIVGLLPRIATQRQPLSNSRM